MRSPNPILSALGVAITFASCSSSSPTHDTQAERAIASVQACGDFEKLSANDKYAQILALHRGSVQAAEERGARFDEMITDLPSKGREIATRLNGFFQRTLSDEEAMRSTITFLAPPVHHHFGAPDLYHTLINSCDFMPQADRRDAKLVHALATFAPAHLTLYPALRVEEADGSWKGKTTENPWTGLLQDQGKDIPMFVRFSIANPVFGHEVNIGKQSLLLEFIPGIGFKFLVDHHESADLVAMESLAGQKTLESNGMFDDNQNYFEKEFSPDFSAHAPPTFSTAPGSEADLSTERGKNAARYGQNSGNKLIMEQVGTRFFQAVVSVISDQIAPLLNVDKRKVAQAIDKHSVLGPNPFILSIDDLARVNPDGTDLPAGKWHRPWKLVFEPAVSEIGNKGKDEAERYARITDKTPYTAGKPETDFRSKLGNLKAGDPIYYVVGETALGARYRIGVIQLDFPPTPSRFADQDFFVRHKIDLERLNNGGSSIITDPAQAAKN